LFVEKRTGSD